MTDTLHPNDVYVIIFQFNFKLLEIEFAFIA